MTAQLRFHESTKISLPHPIRINPMFDAYEIFIEFPGAHTYSYHSKELKKEVQLNSGAVINFRNCKKTNNDRKVVGIISALECNRI